ncbi:MULTISPECIES: mannose-1-phosphate guanylyltransferase [Reichenbachiella]|uniref:mannose-1-phosphate guanylyltransferase n=1 Tax=Reichenbachiella agariperforans TaxID=156994 RepID=A0A1M6NLG5_REIAG|nr:MULTISPECIES: mannose-1-phosphate guanylyltransferase [Reichenbachiella]MBU2915926.1 mannose-1-phosphate guanylyltransferase [Reichenbachiella agariperforans]RJE71818.1 mannose-1-phosphate guanylyltransferase [Reichenbachiella sp. MSK19-1]SHJ96575.1 mannose-1-phosphate guanylyltransferase [Reichenbachiella agariperforans]
MDSNVHIVIMAGGVGSRFWPYSRNAKPKQFIDVLGVGKSLLQLTYERFLSVSNKDNVIVVTNHDYAGLVKEQLPDLSDHQILCEPSRRNTAPCIAYAAYKIHAKDPNAIMVVTPADHVVFQYEKFANVAQQAIDAANGTDKIVTIGIKPTRPETGYGYIQYMEKEKGVVKKVKTFTEKPELELAKTFLESGDFVWNAGIFVWSTKAITNAFKEFLPDIAESFAEGEDLYYTNEEQVFIDKIYPACESISIDYGILEKSPNVHVIEGDFDWSDLGSWDSLHDLRDKDDDQNVVDGDALMFDCKNSIVKVESNRVVILDDLDGYLVGDFKDVLIVCKKDNEAKFRDYVAKVKLERGEKYI